MALWMPGGIWFLIKKDSNSSVIGNHDHHKVIAIKIILKWWGLLYKDL